MRFERVVGALTLIITAACASVATRGPTAAKYDILITNARIVDGTGNPWYRGSVATIGDRIAYVGPSIPGLSARRVIDAQDKVVAPGFIDMLGHSEFAILRAPHAVSKITQGITSEVTGEVHSAWPQVALGEQPDPRYPWRSLGEYFDYLEKNGTAINLGTYVGTSSVRQAVMGDVTRHPTDAEMRQMGALIDSAMRDGAFGVGTGLIYLPSTFFSTEELIALTKYATPYKGGYAAHIRSEGTGLIDAIRETIRIASEAGTWAEIRHIKSRTLEQMQQAVALIDSARAAGIDITADQYPYIASATGLAAMLNTWVQEGGPDSMVVRLRDPAVRARLKMELGQDSAQGIRTAARTMINDVVADSLKKYEGMLLTDAGKLRGEDAYDAAFDILIADRGRTGAIYFSFNEDALRLAMKQPWVSVGQDAGALSPDSTGRFTEREHPRAFGTFPRILGRYVREDSVITLEFAIRKMTSLAAQRVGIADRGLLKPGMFADITVFDPETIIDRSTYENPAQLATGVSYVFVNGLAVVDGGQITNALPGRALRGPGYRARK
ncbi:MAG TPA: amidohydrolase family protein [Gemmatimonadaceae bacterium]|jgi:dihydroorotase/N-acyl-D-amino-acid deacylase|nr:amidohydrolase family protein [Gemmatimonadaceae bacterium]